jgi:hypothetical protein
MICKRRIHRLNKTDWYLWWLIERLSKSIRAESSKKEEDFYKSFGAFSSEKSAEEIINEIKA